MDALQALHNRTSVPKLGDPAPTADQLQAIFRAALRAADHGVLRPWRFLVIRGEALGRLADLFAQATEADTPDCDPLTLEAARAKALRAPVIIVTICRHRESPKVPLLEQQISAGAATQNMLNAAFALGLGAMWRTGPFATHPLVMKGLGLADHETIIAFLYLGSIEGGTKRLVALDTDAFFQNW
ncbi:MAG: hypothetical protein RLZZ385_1385 [Pseudomonadota bacterium]|jgi:nitroreductase